MKLAVGLELEAGIGTFPVDRARPTHQQRRFPPMKSWTILVSLVGILLAGCDSSTNPQPEPPKAPDTTARVAISPSTGAVDSVLLVTMSSTTTGATIRYTLDGSLPGDSSPIYSAPLVLRAATVVQARASAPGLVTSSVTKVAYPISMRRQLVGVWQGSANGVSVTFLLYADSQFVLLETPSVVSAANLAYRSFGTWLTYDSSLVTRSVRSDSSSDGKRWIAQASKEVVGTLDFHLSGDTLGIMGGNYLRKTVAFDSVYHPDSSEAPTIVSDTGSFLSPITVVIVATGAGTKIHYTLDGSTPTKSSPLYTAPIAVSSTSNVKAIAIAVGSLPSREVSSTYRIAPSFLGSWTSLDSRASRSYTFGSDGSYSFLFKDTLTTKAVRASGTWAYELDGYSYTLTKADTSPDGTTWKSVLTRTQSGYSTDISFSGDTLFFEEGVPYLKTSTEPSPRSIVAAPMASLPEGTYLGKRAVALTSATPGAVIRYTLDGGVPTDSSPVYKDSILVRSGCILIAVATKPGMVPSYPIRLGYEIVAPDAVHSTLHDERDGKTYPVVQIGSQSWFAKNLDYAVDSSWCPDGIDSSCHTYGRLYGLHAALGGADKVSLDAAKGVRGICPEGSHLPSFVEWTTLAQRFGGWDNAGVALEAKASDGTDSAGFSILMAGYRSGETFFGSGSTTTFWTASGRNLEFAHGIASVKRYDDSPAYGFSVRCLLD